MMPQPVQRFAPLSQQRTHEEMLDMATDGDSDKMSDALSDHDWFGNGDGPKPETSYGTSSTAAGTFGQAADRILWAMRLLK